MFIAFYIVAGFILVGAFLLRVRKADHLQTCIDSMAKLPSGRLEGIVDYVTQDEVVLSDRDFWRDSRGVRGVVTRLREVRLVLRFLQACVTLGFVDVAEAMRVKQFAYKQVMYSLLALPEALTSQWLADLPHGAALQAAKFHWLTTSHTLTLCQVQGAPQPVLRYGALL